MEPAKVLEYIEVSRFGVEMMIQQGMPKEAQELFNLHLAQFKDNNMAVKTLEIQIMYALKPT